MEKIFLERFSYLLNEKFNGNKTTLSKISGISPSTLSQYFPPRSSSPSARQIYQLAKAFNCSTDYLLGLEDDFGSTVVDTPTLSNDEQTVIECMRSVNENDRKLIIENAKFVRYTHSKYKKEKFN